MAKRKGVKAEKFSFGFGPKLFGFRRGETEYLLSLIPLGGYLKMAGDNAEESKGASYEFLSKTPFQRIQIVVAGPFMNLALAYAVTVTMLAVGIPYPDYPNQVGYVSEALQEEGIQSGDFIVEVEGEEISSWQTLLSTIGKMAGVKEECSITLSREEKTIRLDNITVEKLFSISPLVPPEVGEAMIGAPAYLVGIKEGDRIISVDGESVKYWHELATIIHGSADKEIELMVEREGRTFPIKVTPVSQQVFGENVGIIGIGQPVYDYYVERHGWKSVPYALKEVQHKMRTICIMLREIITHPMKNRKFVGGPFLIFQMAGQEAKKGLSHFLNFMAFVNIMLAVINLLPLPVLDGGHVMFFCLEKLRRKPLSLKTQELIQRVGIALLITLVIFLFANDTLRQIDRRKALHQIQTENKNE